jgi:hydroxymethylpyrimidine/phosphomethylpyrimidine kinase
MAVVTALTAQNTQRVLRVHLPPADFVAVELDAILDDIDVHAVKIGMLGSGEIARAVADRLKQTRAPIVLDTVLAATSGDALGTPDLIGVLREHLFPLVTLITPNLGEAASLADHPIPADVQGMQRIAERLHALGASAVLLKGGHLTGADATDVLFDGKSHRVFTSPRIEAPGETHGTGCTLAAAIAAHLAKGSALGGAIDAAKRYLREALRSSGDLNVGHGATPLNHLAHRAFASTRGSSGLF